MTTSAFVTGGSGFIGGALVRRLVADGWAVRALARSDTSADVVRERGAEPVRGELDDVAAMAAGAAGCEIAFHCAAHLGDWGSREEFVRGNVQGTRNVLAAARQAGVRRFVHVGTEAALLAGQPLIEADERAPLRFDSPALYSSTKARAEEAVIEGNQDGLETVVVRPRFVWGMGETTLLPAMTEMVRAGRFAWIGGGRQRTSTTHVDNAVEGLMLAARRGAPGGVYFVTDGAARGLPRLRHPPARDAGGDAARPLAAGARRQRGGDRGGDGLAAPAAPGPAAADAPGRLAVRCGDDDRHHTRTHRARLRAGQDHRRWVGGAEAAMRIAVGSDHAGFHLKEHVKLALAAAGHDVVDVGTGSPRAVDYPRYAADAARLVGEGDVARAILACSSGVGVAIVANKVAGVRAVNAHDPSEAEMSRRHNDVNIVTLSGARLGPSEADAIVRAFLRTEFEGGRHARRIGQITEMEREPTPAAS